MSDIADIIFGNNTTLFKVLDDLDVPNLSGEVTSAVERVDFLSEQLRQLGVVVDNNQVNNNTSLATLNTKLDNVEMLSIGNSSSINTLTNKVDSLSLSIDIVNTKINDLESTLSDNFTALDEAVLSLESRIVVAENKVNQATAQVEALGNNVNTLIVNVGNLESNVSLLTTTVNNQDSLINSLTMRVISAETSLASVTSIANGNRDKFNSIPISYSELYFSSAYLVPSVTYLAVNQQANNYWQRTLSINPLPTLGSLRMGQPLSGILGGVVWAYIMFTDDVTPVTGDSFRLQNGMIPVGGPIMMLWGNSASSYTRSTVRVTKQYLKV